MGVRESNRKLLANDTAVRRRASARHEKSCICSFSVFFKKIFMSKALSSFCHKVSCLVSDTKRRYEVQPIYHSRFLCALTPDW